jgi:acetyl esterase/lipase
MGKRRQFIWQLMTGGLAAGLAPNAFSKVGTLVKSFSQNPANEIEGLDILAEYAGEPQALWASLALDGPGHDGVGTAPSLVWYWPKETSNIPKGLILICPGGGYLRHAPHEGKDIAQFLNNQGYAAGVVHYTVKPKQHYRPFQDIRRAMLLARQRVAKAFTEGKILRHKIGLIGFSAGGHVAATMGRNPAFLINKLAADPLQVQDDQLLSLYNPVPDVLVLGYPVISMTTFAHMGSVKTLLSHDDKSVGLPDNLALREQFSHQLNVGPGFPPTFLFHTANDKAVPVQNSISLSEACIKQGIPTELHLFPEGKHGIGLAQNFPSLAVWPSLMIAWLSSHIK